MQQRQMYAMQQLMLQQQAQMYAVQQESLQRNAEKQYARIQDQAKKQQELVAFRVERAEQKRTQRAEKFAALKAKRDAENSGTNETISAGLFASKQ